MSARTSAPTRRNNETSRQSDRPIPLRDGPVLRRGFAQTLRVGSKNFTEQFMLDGHAPPLAFSKAQSPLTYWFSVGGEG